MYLAIITIILFFLRVAIALIYFSKDFSLDGHVKRSARMIQICFENLMM